MYAFALLFGVKGYTSDWVHSLGSNKCLIPYCYRGTLWIGSEYDGLAFMTHGRWRVLTKKDGLSHDEVKTIVEDEDGNLWLGTADGITKLSATALRTL